MSRLDLNAMDERASEAPEGPWKVVQLKEFGPNNFIISLSKSPLVEWYPIVAQLYNAGGFKGFEFIARAREDVPRLTAEVRRLERVLRDVIVMLDTAEEMESGKALFDLAKEARAALREGL